MGRPTKRSIQKLSDEIAEIERRDGSVREFGVTSSEQQFVETADSRGKRLFRAGWPDFLCVDKDTGGVIFVEVKYLDDEIRRTQSIMFTALEEHARIRVMVWDPRWPAKLTPWRKYAEERLERLAGSGLPPGPRQPRLHMMSRSGKSRA